MYNHTPHKSLQKWRGHLLKINCYKNKYLDTKISARRLLGTPSSVPMQHISGMEVYRFRNLGLVSISKPYFLVTLYTFCILFIQQGVFTHSAYILLAHLLALPAVSGLCWIVYYFALHM